MITQPCYSQTDTNATGSFYSSVDRLVSNFIDRMQSEQAEAGRQILKKRQMLNEYHQEMIDGMPLEERLKSGNYRF